MSIFNRAINDLTAADLQALLEAKAVENVRLEFKRQEPPKDEVVKKLSSFANTYGGYMIVGADEDGKGRLIRYPGVDEIAGFRQKVVQWCFDEIAPPITPHVSDPIPAPGSAGEVVYVVFVEESMEAPHFLNGRKGVWVRTDEFSQRFELQPATYDEIAHLADRQRLAAEKREDLLERSGTRFSQFVAQDYESDPQTEGNIGATLHLSLTPRVPVKPLLDHAELLHRFEASPIPWRTGQFPYPTGAIVSLHESVGFLRPCAVFSYLEASTWGHLYYVSEVEDLVDAESQRRVIHFHRLLGFVLTFLAHARKFYLTIGYDGSLCVRILLERVLRRPFSIPGRWDREIMSLFDDEVRFDLEVTAERLRDDWEAIGGEILRVIFNATDWPLGVSTDEAVKALINAAWEYNSWGATRRPDARS